MPATKEIFENYLNYSFIETGSCEGNGIQQAIDAGYKDIHSIELDPRYYEKCMNRFKGNKSVHLYQGNSIIELPKVLKTMQERCTIWLDGHFFEPENPQSVILEELVIIAMHFRKNHTILIDDVRLFQTEFKIKLQTVKNMLKLINPAYKIETIDGFDKGILHKDILVAKT